jgi:hypothetical protein
VPITGLEALSIWYVTKWTLDAIGQPVKLSQDNVVPPTLLVPDALAELGRAEFLTSVILSVILAAIFVSFHY